MDYLSWNKWNANIVAWKKLLIFIAYLTFTNWQGGEGCLSQHTINLPRCLQDHKWMPNNSEKKEKVNLDDAETKVCHMCLIFPDQLSASSARCEIDALTKRKPKESSPPRKPWLLLCSDIHHCTRNDCMGKRVQSKKCAGKPMALQISHHPISWVSNQNPDWVNYQERVPWLVHPI